MRYARTIAISIIAAWLVSAIPSPALEQWPTTCVELNDIVEAHLGNDGNVGIYQRVFAGEAGQGCQLDHRDDVRGVFAWAFDLPTPTPDPGLPLLAWPTDCVALNDVVENHLGNRGNVGIYQRAFGDAAELACRSDHREDVRSVFWWAFDGVGPRPGTPAAPSAVPAWLSVDAGYFHTCAIRGDGTVACWGSNSDRESSTYHVGQASPPPGTFRSVSAGNFHPCGVRSSGAVDCWGANWFGQAIPHLRQITSCR